ncbi:MAG: hypothetical protein ABFR19_07800 [Pseudomonadota bacterium]
MLAIGIPVLLVAVAYSQLTLFIMPPVGLTPDGKTLVMRRLDQGDFIDCAESLCYRRHTWVSPLCLFSTTSRALESPTVLASLPYSEYLYRVSVGRERTYMMP